MQSLGTSGILTILHQEEKEEKKQPRTRTATLAHACPLVVWIVPAKLDRWNWSKCFQKLLLHTKQALNKNGVLFEIKTAAKGWMSRCLLFVLCAPNAELAVRMANWLSDFTTAEISPSTPEEHRRQLEFEIMVPATGVRTLLLWNQNPRCEQFQAVWRDVVSCRAWQLAVETLLVLTSLVFLVFFVLLVLLLLTSSTKKNFWMF